jgi:hypothetical protein
MPIDVTLEDDGGLIITATGNFTGEEMIAAAESLRQQGVTPSDVAYELVDMRDSTPIDHSEIVAQQLTAYVYVFIKINDKLIIAIVANDDLSYGLSRMWKARDQENDHRVMVCRDLAEARAWIASRLND